MNASEDVKILFRRFGGEANSYQEVVRERAAGQALGKWAMLGQVDLLHPQTVQSVHRSVNTAATRHVALEPIHTAARIPAVHVVQPTPTPQAILAVTAAAPTRASPPLAVRTTSVAPTQEIPRVLPSALSSRPAVVRPVEVTPAARSPFAAVPVKAPAAAQPISRPTVVAAAASPRVTPSHTAPVTGGHRSALGNSLNARLLHPSGNEGTARSDKQSLVGLFGRLAKSTFSFTSAPHSALQRKFAK